MTFYVYDLIYIYDFFRLYYKILLYNTFYIYSDDFLATRYRLVNKKNHVFIKSCPFFNICLTEQELPIQENNP